MLEFQRLMVKADRFVQLPTQMVDETQRKESLSVARVQTYTLFQKVDSVFVLLELAAGVGQVGQDRLHNPEAGVGMAEP